MRVTVKVLLITHNTHDHKQPKNLSFLISINTHNITIHSTTS